MKLRENRSGLLAFLISLLTFGIFNIVQAFQIANEANITCTSYDNKHTKNPLHAFLISLLLNLVGVGWIYWLIYKYNIIQRMENFTRKSGEKPKLSGLLLTISKNMHYGIKLIEFITLVNKAY